MAKPMTVQEMLTAINRRVDDFVDPDDAIEWLNAGKNRMAAAVDADFPDVSLTDLNGTFPFDAVYHEGPVLYACAMYKQTDQSFPGEAANFMAQFEQLKSEFATKYVVPPRYRNDRFTQQFTAVSSQPTYTVTKFNYNSKYGRLKVYVNDVLCSDYTVNDDNTFTINTPLNDGDAITAIWEEHQDLVEPPYPWWSW